MEWTIYQGDSDGNNNRDGIIIQLLPPTSPDSSEACTGMPRERRAYPRCCKRDASHLCLDWVRGA